MIYNFKNDFIKSLQQKYMFQGKTQILNNTRYYVAGLKVNDIDMYICLPLHSNSRYAVKIEPPVTSSNSKHWKNHGIDVSKGLLLTKSEFDIYNDGIGWIEKNVVDDIKKKEKLIKKKTLTYIRQYLSAYEKRSDDLNLTKVEKNILNYSSLNSFEDKIRILVNIKIEKLTLIDMDKIELIELAQEEEYLNKLRNSISIAEYARDVLGLNVLKETKGMFRIETKDVYLIYPNNTFGHLSKSIGGDVICFVKHFHSVETEEAIEMLKKYYYETTPEERFNASIKSTNKNIVKGFDKDLEVPAKADTNKNVMNYLVNKRGIPESIVNDYIDRGILYEDDHMNCVFIDKYKNHVEGIVKIDINDGNESIINRLFVDNNSKALVINSNVIEQLSCQALMDEPQAFNYLSYDMNDKNAVSALRIHLAKRESDKKLERIIVATNDEPPEDLMNFLSSFVTNKKVDIYIEPFNKMLVENCVSANDVKLEELEI